MLTSFRSGVSSQNKDVLGGLILAICSIIPAWIRAVVELLLGLLMTPVLAV